MVGAAWGSSFLFGCQRKHDTKYMSISETLLLSVIASATGGQQLASLALTLGALTQGAQALTGVMGDYAHAADGAVVAARSWQTVLKRMKVDQDEAEQSMQSLSKRTGASVEDLKAAASQYLKMGGTLRDFERGALAAASSWYDLANKSITLKDSISNVTLAIGMGRSELMETSGIVTNASVAWKEYAKANNIAVKDMDTATKAHAYALSVYQEEKIGIETLAEKQTDLSRAENENAKAKRQFAIAVGQHLLPAYTDLVKLGTQVVSTSADIAKAFKAGEKGIDDLAKKYPQLGGGIKTAVSLFNQLKKQGTNSFNDLKKQAEPILKSLSNAMESAFRTGERLWHDVLKPSWDDILPSLRKVADGIMPLLRSVAVFIDGVFHGIRWTVDNVFIPAWDSIGPIVKNALEFVLGKARSELDLLAGIFRSTGKLLKGDWQAAWEDIKKTALKYINDLANLAKTSGDKLIKAGKSLGQQLLDGFTAISHDFEAFLLNMIADAISKAGAGMPELLRKPFDLAAGAARREATRNSNEADKIRNPNAGMAKTFAGYASDDLSKAIVQATFGKTGNYEADNLVDWCARWVKRTLQQAEPKAANTIAKWFGGDADHIKERAQKAGIMRKDLSQLKAGDVVVYDKNHVGVYIGGGLVRGNNRVTQGREGQPVGNVKMESLGSVAGFIRVADLIAEKTSTKVAKTVATKQQTATNATATPNQAKGLKPLPEFVDLKKQAADLKKHSLNLEKWLELRIKAIQLAKQQSEAEDDLTGKKAVQVKADIEAWADNDKVKKDALNLATKLYSKQQDLIHQRANDEQRAAEERRQQEEELTRLSIAQAQIRNQKLTEIEQAKLQRFKGAEEEKLKLVQEYSQRQFNRVEIIARKQRNAAIEAAKGTANEQAQIQLAKSTYNAAVESARLTRSAIVQAARKDVAEANKAAVEEQKQQYADLRQQTIEGLGGRTSDGLASVYSQAVATKDKELLNAVYDEWERRAALAVESEKIIINLQAEGNKRVAKEAIKAGKAMGPQTRMNHLQDVLGDLYAMSAQGENAADAINAVVDEINALDAEWGSFLSDARRVAESGPVEGISRNGEPVKITDQESDALKQRNNEKALEKYRLAAATEKYKDSLKDLTIEELKHLEAQAVALNAWSNLPYILAELAAKTEEANQAAAEHTKQLDAAANVDTDRFEQWVDRTSKLEQAFQNGELSAKDFTAQAFALLPQLEQLAKAAEQSGNLGLAEAYRVTGRQLANMVPETEAAAYSQALLANATQELNEQLGHSKASFADTIQRLKELRNQAGINTEALDKLIKGFEKLQAKAKEKQALEEAKKQLDTYLGAAKNTALGLEHILGGLNLMGEDAAADWSNSLTSMVDDIGNFAGNVMKIMANPADIGAWVAAITQAVTTIFGHAAQERQAFEAEQKKAAEYNKQFKFSSDGYGTREVTTRITGILFWSKTHYDEAIDQAGKDLALSIEGAVINGTHDGFTKALESGNVEDMEKAMFKSLRDLARKALIDGFLASAAVMAVLGPLIEKLIAAFRSGNKEQIKEALAEFKTGVKTLKKDMEGLVEAGKAIDEAFDDDSPMDRLRERFHNAVKNGVESGARNALKHAITTGDMSNITEIMKSSIADAVIDALITGFLESTAIQKLLGPAMDELTEALMDDDPTNDDAAWAKFNSKLEVVGKLAQKFGSRVRGGLQRAGLLPVDGNTGKNGSVSNQPTLKDPMEKGISDAERQKRIDAIEKARGKGGTRSYAPISRGGMHSGGAQGAFDASVGRLTEALDGATQLASAIRETARINTQAAAEQLRAARLNLQAAGQRYAGNDEQSRMNFGGNS